MAFYLELYRKMSFHALRDVSDERKTDSRYEQSPVLDDVAYLSVETEKGFHGGTGFLVKIEGHFIVMTSAHCLYGDHSRDLTRSVKIFLGRKTESDEPTFTRSLTDIYDPHDQDRSTTQKNFEMDYVFVYIGPNQEFSDYKGLRLQNFEDAEIVQAENTIITGYPVTHGGSEHYRQYSVKLTDIRFDSQKGLLTYNDATFGRMSGAPLYVTSDEENIVFGIHVNRNKAVRLTKDEITSIGEAVLGVTGCRTVKWQHYKMKDQQMSTHIDSDKSERDK